MMCWGAGIWSVPWNASHPKILCRSTVVLGVHAGLFPHILGEMWMVYYSQANVGAISCLHIEVHL